MEHLEKEKHLRVDISVVLPVTSKSMRLSGGIGEGIVTSLRMYVRVLVE